MSGEMSINRISAFYSILKNKKNQSKYKRFLSFALKLFVEQWFCELDNKQA